MYEDFFMEGYYDCLNDKLLNEVFLSNVRKGVNDVGGGIYNTVRKAAGKTVGEKRVSTITKKGRNLIEKATSKSIDKKNEQRVKKGKKPLSDDHLERLKQGVTRRNIEDAKGIIGVAGSSSLPGPNIIPAVVAGRVAQYTAKDIKNNKDKPKGNNKAVRKAARAFAEGYYDALYDIFE